MVDIWPKVQSLLLVPPGIIVIVALLGFLIQTRWAVLGTTIAVLNIAALLILSLPVTGYRLMVAIEAQVTPLPHPLTTQISPAPEAIVVLGGGRYTDALEYGGDSTNKLTLERLRYAAYLHRATQLPILVSGGAPFNETVSEAALMQDALTKDFQTPARWVEDKSATTQANATYTKTMLAAAGIRRIYLVTHASHMPRALWAFENAGLSVVPAPTGFSKPGKQDSGILGYLPTESGLSLSSMALRERLGLIWYQRKFRAPAPALEPSPATAH